MYTFIVNPNARSGLGHKIWSSLEEVLKEKNVEYEVLFTKYQHHATKLVHKLTSTGEECTIIALGGDGTINEVVNGIQDISKVTLGYIPIGSSNDFARSLKLSTDAHEALKHILNPSAYKYINVGTLEYKDKKRRFAVSSGLGFDAAVCHQIVISKLKLILNKVGLGKLTYVAVAIQRLMAQNPKPMTLTFDDGRQVNFKKAYFAAAMNQKYEGGGFKFCPKADPSDDILDIIVASDISKLKVLCLLPTAFKGWHVHIKGIYTYQCKYVDIESEIALPVHTDGEPVFLQRKARLGLEPEKLRLILS